MYIDELPKLIRRRGTKDDLDLTLRVKLFEDDISLAAKRQAAIQAHRNERRARTSDYQADWASENLIMMFMRESDATYNTFILAIKPIRNTSETEYLGLRFTRSGFVEKPLNFLISKGMSGLRKLRNMDCFNEVLSPKDTKCLYLTYVHSRIMFGFIVCRTHNNTCVSDETLTSEYFTALLKLKYWPN